MKLKLNVEDLRVDTFEAERAPDRRRGTVRANGATDSNGQPFCSGFDCPTLASCYETCGLSCNPSCVETYAECCAFA
jgi:hypothetical protein